MGNGRGYEEQLARRITTSKSSSFGGILLGEVMLTFGGASSAGIYNDAAKLVKEFAVRASSTDDRMINQILDDVICVG